MIGKIKITLTTGEEYTVKTTIADRAKWDRARKHYNWDSVNYNDFSGAINLMTCYVAYACMVRLKHYEGNYEDFENLLEDVLPVEEEIENKITPLQ